MELAFHAQQYTIISGKRWYYNDFYGLQGTTLSQLLTRSFFNVRELLAVWRRRCKCAAVLANQVYV